MTRMTAAERLGRIVAIVPWIAERDGPTIEEICDRFAVDRRELLADLDVVFMVGIPPYTPDELVDVFIDDDRVWVTLGEYFRRPLRLTTAEALQLMAAAESFGAVTGADPRGPLSRGIEKVSAALGIEGRDVISVNVGTADAGVAAEIRDALTGGRSLDIRYHAASNDEVTERRIDPHRLFAAEGHIYVSAWCHQAQGERVFRVDRILEATATGEPRRVEPTTGRSTRAFFGGPPGRSVVLRLDPEARWVVGTYPTAGVTARDDGRFDAVLPVAGDAWLARLLLRLGPAVEVVSHLDADGNEVDPDVPLRIRRELAREILDRYA